jgi:PhoH-like ATPase
VLEDTDLLYTGVLPAAADFWDKHGKDMESWQEGATPTTASRARWCPAAGQPVRLPRGRPAFLAVRAEITRQDRGAADAQGLHAPEEQRLGHHRAQPRAELRAQPADGPGVDFVTLLGQAGTGKTLLALAAGLMQVLDDKRYTEIIMTRVTVPVGEDIGFLPGTEEEKMTPWMGALEDNLDVLNDRRRAPANGAARRPTT